MYVGAGVTDDHHCAPEGVSGNTCGSTTQLYDEEWFHTFYDDTHWEEARLYSDQEVSSTPCIIVDNILD